MHGKQNTHMNNTSTRLPFWTLLYIVLSELVQTQYILEEWWDDRMHTVVIVKKKILYHWAPTISIKTQTKVNFILITIIGSIRHLLRMLRTDQSLTAPTLRLPWLCARVETHRIYPPIRPSRTFWAAGRRPSWGSEARRPGRMYNLWWSWPHREGPASPQARRPAQSCRT